MCNHRNECDKYYPDCKLYGYFDENGKPRVKKVRCCENDGRDGCKKKEDN